jgi:integrase
MPKFKQGALPKYGKHKASGRAVVKLNGRDVYLGPYGSQESRVEYDRVIGEWLTAGRSMPKTIEALGGVTVNELLVSYLEFAERHYQKDGEPTGELGNIKDAARPLKNLYGHTEAAKFGPLALKAIRSKMIAGNLSRGVINSRINRIKRIFKWAASEELVSPSVWHGLISVQGLQRGRSDARETEPIRPVADIVVDATLAHLTTVVRSMVEFQRLVGCRPNEVVQLRPADIDRTGDVWCYTPRRHKCQHHNQARRIAIGPRAQAVLAPYLDRSPELPCFSPAESEAIRKAALRAKRKTKVQPSQINRTRAGAKRKPRNAYNGQAYQLAVRRGCDKAFPVPKTLTNEAERKAWRKAHWWHPNQLRHSVATMVRHDAGLEAAQAVLGHAKADTTQIYAESNWQAAVEVMRRVG